MFSIVSAQLENSSFLEHSSVVDSASVALVRDVAVTSFNLSDVSFSLSGYSH